MPVREWMSAPVASIEPERPAVAAAALMRARGVRHLPVVDARGHVVGVVTDRDLRQVVFDPAIQARLGELTVASLGDLPVREVMTWGAITVEPSADVRAAARLLHERKVGALPVVQDGRLVGILTERDLLRAFERLAGDRVAGVRPLEPAATGQDWDFGFLPPPPASNEGAAGGGGA
jgi:acetoin utilization protein AcuB